MKSFADWTQELAEAQQGPKPEPVLDYRLFDNKIMDGTVECDQCCGEGSGTWGSCSICEGTGRVEAVECGCGRGERGAPNADGGRYYCNAGPPYNCQP